MAPQHAYGPGDHEQTTKPDATFKRHGPEPPENDSGPSDAPEEINRGADEPESRIRNVTPDQQVD